MIELKNFAFQVEQMRLAQIRLKDLLERTVPDEQAIKDMQEITRHLEIVVDDSIEDVKAQLRIEPAQVNADSDFNYALERALHQWNKELAQVQKEQIGQATIDAKAGAKSMRLTMLEKQEAELKAKIREAEERIGKVSVRVGSSKFRQEVAEVINQAAKNATFIDGKGESNG